VQRTLTGSPAGDVRLTVKFVGTCSPAKAIVRDGPQAMSVQTRGSCGVWPSVQADRARPTKPRAGVQNQRRNTLGFIIICI
jgi:hypothetical protein